MCLAWLNIRGASICPSVCGCWEDFTSVFVGVLKPPCEISLGFCLCVWKGVAGVFSWCGQCVFVCVVLYTHCNCGAPVLCAFRSVGHMRLSPFSPFHLTVSFVLLQEFVWGFCTEISMKRSCVSSPHPTPWSVKLF